MVSKGFLVGTVTQYQHYDRRVSKISCKKLCEIMREDYMIFKVRNQSKCNSEKKED